ncbi:unnamed protein product [Brassica oleracea var. botrytis]
MYGMFRVERECHCVIDDVLFLWDRYKRVFKWYDSKSYSWKDLIGIEGLPELSPDPQVCQVEMVDLGGKIGSMQFSLFHHGSTCSLVDGLAYF